jgi:hypothetical protein
MWDLPDRTDGLCWACGKRRVGRGLVDMCQSCVDGLGPPPAPPDTTRPDSLWLLAVGAAPIPYRTAGEKVQVHLRINQVLNEPASIGWWILDQTARMMRRGLRVKEPNIDLDTVEWFVIGNTDKPE